MTVSWPAVSSARCSLQAQALPGIGVPAAARCHSGSITYSACRPYPLHRTRMCLPSSRVIYAAHASDATALPALPAQIEKLPGGTIEDCRVLKGVMFNKDVVLPNRWDQAAAATACCACICYISGGGGGCSCGCGFSCCGKVTADLVLHCEQLSCCQPQLSSHAPAACLCAGCGARSRTLASCCWTARWSTRRARARPTWS